MLILRFGVLFCFFSSMDLANASTLDLQARSFQSSCNYYSATRSQLKVQYTNLALPWGVRVFLVSGFEGRDSATRDTMGRPSEFQWRETTEQEIFSSGPYTWEFQTEWNASNRGQSVWKDGVNFVLKIVASDGQVTWDKGLNSFYRANVISREPGMGASSLRCVNGPQSFSDPLIDWLKLTLENL